MKTVTPDARGNSSLSKKCSDCGNRGELLPSDTGGSELIMSFDTERFERRINGVNVFAGLSAKVRL